MPPPQDNVPTSTTSTKILSKLKTKWSYSSVHWPTLLSAPLQSVKSNITILHSSSRKTPSCSAPSKLWPLTTNHQPTSTNNKHFHTPPTTINTQKKQKTQHQKQTTTIIPAELASFLMHQQTTPPHPPIPNNTQPFPKTPYTNSDNTPTQHQLHIYKSTTTEVLGQHQPRKHQSCKEWHCLSAHKKKLGTYIG